MQNLGGLRYNINMNNNNSTNNLVTGYQATKFVNEYLTVRGLKEIPPQMVYNYMKKGYIESVIVNGQKMIDIETLGVWVEKYVARKLLK